MLGREFCLAVGQSPAELSTSQERLAWLGSVLPQVAEQGSDLMLLPELFATGYNIGTHIPARAEPADGPTSQVIATLAQKHGIAIHYGFVEQDGDRIYNAAQCICPDGKRVRRHRKLIIPPGFEQDHFTRGQGCTLFTFAGVKVATLICYDAEFPEAARHVASLGAELILIPTALGHNWEWVAQRMIPTRAYANGVFLAYANSAGEENEMRFLGQSFIAAPDGQELARAGAQPEIIFAILELERVAAAQTRLPYLIDRYALNFDVLAWRRNLVPLYIAVERSEQNEI